MTKMWQTKSYNYQVQATFGLFVDAFISEQPVCQPESNYDSGFLYRDKLMI